ncbi:MAG: hypothetical protein WA957_00815 [Alteraurantiacibacter sp.]
MIGVQERTGTRGEHLGALQRGLYLLVADLEHLSQGPALNEGVLVFVRSSTMTDYQVSYRFAEGALLRSVGDEEHAVLTGVENYDLRFLKDGVWQTIPSTETNTSRPAAVEIQMEMASGPGLTGGPIRRVVELPQE